MRTRALLLAATLAIAAACGDDGGLTNEDDTASDDAASELRVGRFDFTESEIVATLYTRALESVGVPARVAELTGKREILAPALEQGLLDLVPEYLGFAVTQFGAGEIDPAGSTVDDLRAVLEPRGMTALTPAPAESINVFVVLAESGLGPALSDLADVAPSLRFGATPECRDRAECLAGLEATYGLRFAAFVAEPKTELRVEALQRDEIDVALLFSTDAIITDELLVLDDDQGLQPPGNVVPVVRTDALDRWGADIVGDVLDQVSAALTTTELRRLNQAVGRGDTVAEVVDEWLVRQGVVTSP